MKIAFLSRYQKTIERGAENFVKELSVNLSKKHTVDIFVGKDADSLNKILKGNYDVVIPINGRMQSLKASLGRLAGKYKILISGQSGIGKDDIWNIFIARPNIFVALTDSMSSWAKKWAIGGKVVKIPNGIDTNKFSPNGIKTFIDLPKPVILSVGALTWYKNHEQVIKAVSKMSYGSLLIVGQGEEKEKLEKLGKDLLGDRFKISEYKYEDMPKLYRSVDLFTLPSWDREAFGLVYLEAMASGLGVIAPDDSSRREIIGDAGILVNTKDVDKYKDAIEQGLKIDWQKKAINQAKKFSWDKIAKQYEYIMLNMLEKTNA